MGEERITREVHLGHQALGERPAEHREVDVRRPPGVGVIAPWVGAGPDGDEPVGAVGLREAPSRAREVGIERGGMLVQLVDVPPGRVGLPDLHELAGDRAAVQAEDPAGDDDPLTERLTRVLAGEIGVLGTDAGVAEDGTGALGRTQRKRDQRPVRSAPPALSRLAS